MTVARKATKGRARGAARSSRVPHPSRMTGRLLVSAHELPPAAYSRRARAQRRRTDNQLTASCGSSTRAASAASAFTSPFPCRPRNSGCHSCSLTAWVGDTSRCPTAGYSGPGREPLTISLEDFIGSSATGRHPSKAALLNPVAAHGVGNIYGREGLFRAGIRPRRQAGRLTSRRTYRLRAAP